jgi:hypothetical protein
VHLRCSVAGGSVEEVVESVWCKAGLTPSLVVTSGLLVVEAVELDELLVEVERLRKNELGGSSPCCVSEGRELSAISSEKSGEIVEWGK